MSLALRGAHVTCDLLAQEAAVRVSVFTVWWITPRAYFLEKASTEEVCRRFHYTPGSFRVLYPELTAR